jgi:uracil-DNA glycosylase
METAGTGVKSDISIDPSWKQKLSSEFEKEYFYLLKNFLSSEKKKGAKIFPPGNKIFSAFDHTPFDKVKVVIIGQDPYHGEGQANGLCFSVSDGISKPPSLVNILKELQDDLGIPVPVSGNLIKWSEQGVLLLNATLTVRAGEAGSHQNKGWEQFTDAVIRILSSEGNGIVFLLWGKYAQAKEELIDASKHYILKAAHPSPLARGAFFGCKHFSKTNEILVRTGRQPVDWSLS